MKQEIESWAGIFDSISDDKKQIATKLINEVAFMKTTLDILKINIQLDGATYLFKNGKQEMIVEHPAQKSYNTMINRYTATCNSIFNLLPKDVTQDDDDGFETFIGKR